MSHRGRLNVMVHIVGQARGRDLRRLRGRRSAQRHGRRRRQVPPGRDRRLPRPQRPRAARSTWSPTRATSRRSIRSPSGRVRAKQTRLGGDARRQVLPIAPPRRRRVRRPGHAAETLNMADLAGFDVGGTIHVIVNNLIGFTTAPRTLHSSRFASDVAGGCRSRSSTSTARSPRRSCGWRAMAVDYRAAFASDVVVDLIGYRRHGHSEVDDPTITQPLLYQKIERAAAALASLRRAARAAGGRDRGAGGGASRRASSEEHKRRARRSRRSRRCATLPGLLGPLPRRPLQARATRWTTGVPRRAAGARSARGSTAAPEASPSTRRSSALLEQRAEMARRQARRRLGHGRGAGVRLARRRAACRCASPARTPGAARSTSATRC